MMHDDHRFFSFKLPELRSPKLRNNFHAVYKIRLVVVLGQYTFLF